jgi:hypothetical protein
MLSEAQEGFRTGTLLQLLMSVRGNTRKDLRAASNPPALGGKGDELRFHGKWLGHFQRANWGDIDVQRQGSRVRRDIGGIL